jgi:drug/metabolite transporter (DMT)-like permease
MILSSRRTRAAERGRTILTGTVTPDVTPHVTRRRGRSTAAWIALGVAAVSVAAPLIRLADAPALVVALYRNLVALAVLAPAALLLNRDDLRRLGRSDLGWCLLAGAALAAHFATWVTSLSMTTVASSTALVATAPVFVAAAGTLWLAERVGRRGWLGIALAVAGAAALAGADLRVSGQALAGDLLALAGAAFAAVYLLAGRVVRRRLPLLPYVTVTYATAAALLLPAVLLRGDPLTGFGPWRWAALVGLGLGPQVLGHTVFNFLLGRLRADAVAVAVLGEPIGASILALVIFREVPPLAALPGALAVLAGIWLTLRDAGAEAT